MNVKPTADVGERDRATDTIRDYLTGVETWKPITEHYSDRELTDLKAEVEAIELTPESPPADLIRKTILAAAYRDLRYATATRGQLLALAAQNALRNNFEHVKMFIDSGQSL